MFPSPHKNYFSCPWRAFFKPSIHWLLLLNLTCVNLRLWLRICNIKLCSCKRFYWIYTLLLKSVCSSKWCQVLFRISCQLSSSTVYCPWIEATIIAWNYPGFPYSVTPYRNRDFPLCLPRIYPNKASAADRKLTCPDCHQNTQALSFHIHRL